MTVATVHLLATPGRHESCEPSQTAVAAATGACSSTHSTPACGARGSRRRQPRGVTPRPHKAPYCRGGASMSKTCGGPDFRSG